MNNIKIAVSIGHTPEAQGAKNGMFSEYGISSAVAGCLVSMLTESGALAYLISPAPIADKVNNINCIAPDFGLEIHFNANINPNIGGTLCMHSGYLKSKSLAHCVSQKLHELIRTRSSSVKKGYYRLDPLQNVVEIIRNTYCPFIIVEPLYLTNSKDFNKIFKPELISLGIFLGIKNYLIGKN